MDRTALRQDKLRRTLRREAIDALLVSNEHNVSYLTGFSGDSSYLLLGRQGSILISDGRYAAQIEQECPGLEAYIRHTTGEKMSESVAKVVRSRGIRRLAFESSTLTVAQLGTLRASLAELEFIAWDGAVEALRSRKDPDEVRQIRGAIQLAERAFEMFRSSVRVGETEKVAADRMEMFLRMAGAGIVRRNRRGGCSFGTAARAIRGGHHSGSHACVGRLGCCGPVLSERLDEDSGDS
jgi:Xaa-Pro aminopeptidase